MNYQQICEQVKELVLEVGSFIREERKHFNSDRIEVKGQADFVSYVDKTSERRLVEKLEKILPEAGFIAEEGTSTRRGERFNWIIDPLDGTTNFIHGIAPYAISIALNEGQETVIGIVLEINLNECFYAWKGSKVYLNGKEIQVSEAATTKDALIATGFPYYNFDRLSDYINSMDYFLRNSHGMRRLGSAATDLAYVAAGRFEAFYEYALHAWDVAAGAFLVRQAGGIVSDFKGGDDYIFGEEIVASNSNYYDEFFSIVKQHLVKL
ncbi:MAG: inositol monophosphatase family protein [Bacteroidota bacterium]|nr:inositol monophosphatase family protein [Bacteroidota bacterium]